MARLPMHPISEPGALLDEGHKLHRQAGALTFLPPPLHALYGRYDPQPAIQDAARGNRIQVRAGHHHRKQCWLLTGLGAVLAARRLTAGSRTFQPPDQVPHHVEAGAEARPCHPCTFVLPVPGPAMRRACDPSCSTALS